MLYPLFSRCLWCGRLFYICSGNCDERKDANERSRLYHQRKAAEEERRRKMDEEDWDL